VDGHTEIFGDVRVLRKEGTMKGCPLFQAQIYVNTHWNKILSKKLIKRMQGIK
jgi:hypothetical protein